MPSPIPVYITDCVEDCIAILHAGEGYVWLAIAGAAFFAVLTIFLLSVIVISVAFRRHG